MKTRSRFVLALCVAVAFAWIGTAKAIDMAEANGILKNEAKDANKLFSLSFYFDRQNRPFNAMKAIEKAIKIDSSIQAYYARLGYLQLSRSRYKEAAATFEKAIKIDADAAAFRAAYARALEEIGRDMDSAVQWRKLVESSTDEKSIVDAANRSNRLLQRQRAYADAVGLWKVTLSKVKTWGNRRNAAYNIADNLVRQNLRMAAIEELVKFGTAEEPLDNAVQVGEKLSQIPNQAEKSRDALTKKAVAYWQLLLKRATDAKSPNQQSRALEMLAVFAAYQGDVEEAIKIIRPALDLPIDCAKKWQIADKVGKWTTCVGKASELPKFYRKMFMVLRKPSYKIKALDELANVDKAADLSKLWIALSMQTDDAGQLHTIASRLESSGKVDIAEVIKVHKRILGKNGKDRTSLAAHARLLEKTGDEQAAADAHFLILTMLNWNSYSSERRMITGSVRWLLNKGKQDELAKWLETNQRKVTWYGRYTLNSVADELYRAKSPVAERCLSAMSKWPDVGNRLARHVQKMYPEWSKKEYCRLYLIYKDADDLRSAASLGLDVDSQVEHLQKVLMAARKFSSQWRYSAMYLLEIKVRQNKLGEALDFIRQADPEFKHNEMHGLLSSIAGGLTDKHGRAAKHLRSKQALSSTAEQYLAFYKSMPQEALKKDYGFSAISKLVELMDRYGFRDEAKKTLAAAMEINDYGAETNEFAARRFDGWKMTEEAGKAAIRYSDAKVENKVRSYSGKRLRYLSEASLRYPRWINKGLVDLIRKCKMQDEFLKHLEDQIGKTQGHRHYGYISYKLEALAHLKLLDDAEKELKRFMAEKLVRPLSRYKRELEIARQSKGKSKWDEERRNQLARQLESIKKTWQKNPEDYNTALNIYRTLRNQGKLKEGVEYLKKALKVAPNDPLVLEACGNEYSYLKMYNEARSTFQRAAEISGQQTKVESKLILAFELSGGYDKALELAVRSLAEGRQARDLNKLLDMAQRWKKEDFLIAELKKRLDEPNVHRRIIELSLRLGWRKNDAELSDKALKISVARNEIPTNLFDEAKKLDRMKEAADLRMAKLKEDWVKSHRVNSSSYRELALLLIGLGRSADAAELLMRGFGRDCAKSLAIANHEWDNDFSRAIPYASASQVSKWRDHILRLSAKEKLAGANDFTNALKDQINKWIEAELRAFQEAPGNNSVILDREIQDAFKLWDKITDAYASAAKKDGAAWDDSWRYANRLKQLFMTPPKSGSQTKATAAAIIAACNKTIELAPTDIKAERARAVAQLYYALHGMPEEKRPKEITPAFLFTSYERAVKIAEETKKDLSRYLSDALNIATQLKMTAAADLLTQKLCGLRPKDTNLQRASIPGLLRAGKTDEALAIAKKILGDDPHHNQQLSMARQFLQAKNRAAARHALDFIRAGLKGLLFEKGIDSIEKIDSKKIKEVTDFQVEALSAHLLLQDLPMARSSFISAVYHNGDESTTYSRNWRGQTRVLDSPEKRRSKDLRIKELIKAHKDAGKTLDLCVALAKAVAKDPRDIMLRLAHAQALQADGKPDAASNALQVAKALSPDLTTVKQLINLLEEAGRLKEAIAECRAWADAYSSDWNAWTRLAELYRKAGDSDREWQALSMLVAIAPREAPNCRKVAALLIDRKDYSRAIPLLERAKELRNEEPWRQVDLAEANFLAGNYEAAIKEADGALKKDWRAGLAPELRVRLPDWTGTFENRARSILADAYDAMKDNAKAAQVRAQFPNDYKRPEFAKAIPATPPPRGRWRPWGRMVVR